jgi:nucleotide-binding universal stress UspA family protein
MGHSPALPREFSDQSPDGRVTARRPMRSIVTAMPDAHSILCPVDFSEQSREALLWASAIAERRGGQLTVLSVVEPLLVQAARIRLGIDLVKAEVEPELRQFVEATLPGRARQASRVTVEVTAGDPPDAILAAARTHKAGLVVMGTNGLGGVKKLLLGSTTEKVLRRTETPVLVVPAGAVGAPAAEQPAVQLKKILLATDFHESAMSAVQWAGDLAADIGVPLVLAHVVEPVVVPHRWQALVADFEDDRVASGQRKLAELAGRFGNTPSESIVSVGRPADTIASLAVEHGAGLVVMGLANREGAQPRTPGSIAYRVLRLAHVAVAVVPPAGSPTP